MKSAYLAAVMAMVVMFGSAPARAACKIDPRTGDCPMPGPDITEPEARAQTVSYGENAVPGSAGRWAFGGACASGGGTWACHAHAELNATYLILSCVVSITHINCTLCVLLSDADQCTERAIDPIVSPDPLGPDDEISSYATH